MLNWRGKAPIFHFSVLFFCSCNGTHFRTYPCSRFALLGERNALLSRLSRSGICARQVTNGKILMIHFKNVFSSLRLFCQPGEGKEKGGPGAADP